jgi:hypothetical protein
MVTERNTGSRASGFRDRFEGYLKDFGTQVVRTRVTEIKDSMNRVISSSNVDVTYYADIQWLTKQDLSHLNLGDVKIGDGQIFFEYDVDVEIHDKITFNNKEWRVSSQVEGEVVSGDVVYKGFIITKNSQS